MTARRAPLTTLLALLPAAGATAASTPLAFVRSDWPSGIVATESIAVGDFNEDGLPDIVVAGLNDQAVLLINDGKGGFAARKPFNVNAFDFPFWVSAADFNGDGHLDAIVCALATDYLDVLLGDGKGNLVSLRKVTVGDAPIHVNSADLDGDGRPDFVVCNSGSGFLTILYGNGSRVDVPVDLESHTTSIRDFNEDGRLDLAVSFGDFDENSVILLASGPRSFRPPVLLHAHSGYHMAAGDFNGDGHADLVTAPYVFSDNYLMLGRGDGTFDARVVLSVGGLFNDVQVADLNCDGLDDAVFVNQDLSYVFLGDRASGLVPGPVLPTGKLSTSLAPADFDQDGVIDLAFSDEGDETAAYERNVTVFLDCPPAVTVERDPRTCLVDLRPTTCDHTLVITSDPPLPADLGCGVHTVTFTATDPEKRTATCTTVVTVVDTTKPVVKADPSNQVCLWPPDHKYACFEHLSSMVKVDGGCGLTTLAIECRSDQCDDARCADHPDQNGDGHTTHDCLYDAKSDTLCVRSERDGTIPGGRHYGVTFVATDDCGNHSDPVVGFRVYVPHDQDPHEPCARPGPTR